MTSSILDLPIEIIGRIFTIGCEMTIPTSTIDLISPHPFASRFNFRNKRRMKGFTLLCALVCSRWYQITRFEGYRHLWVSRLRISEWDGGSIEHEFGQYMQDLKQVDGEDLDIYWGMACNEAVGNGELIVRIFLHAMNVTLPYRHSIRRLIAVLESPLALRCMLSFISDSPPAKSLMWFGIGSFWLGSTFTFPEEGITGDDYSEQWRLQVLKQHEDILYLYNFESYSIRCDLTHVMHSLGHVGIYDVAVHQIILPSALTSLDLKRMSTFDFPLEWNTLKSLLSQCHGLTKLDLDLFYTSNFPNYSPSTEYQRERVATYKLRLLSVCARIQDCYALLLWFPFPDLTEFLFQYIADGDEDSKARAFHIANTPGLQYDRLKTLVVRRPCGYDMEWLSTWTLPSLERLRLVNEIFSFGRNDCSTPPDLFVAPGNLEVEAATEDHVLRILSYLDTENVRELKLNQNHAPNPDEERRLQRFPLPRLERLTLANMHTRFLFEGNLVIDPGTVRTLELAQETKLHLSDFTLLMTTDIRAVCSGVEEVKMKLAPPPLDLIKCANPLSFFPNMRRLTLFVDNDTLEVSIVPWFVPTGRGLVEQVSLGNLRQLVLEVNLEKKSSLGSKYTLLQEAKNWLQKIVESRRERGLRAIEEVRVDAVWGDAGCWSQ